MEKRKIFQCKNCHHQTTVTVNTIFHRTHVPLRKWFWAISLVGADKRGCSAKWLEKLIGLHYATAWLMIHKIRKAMEKRDALNKLYLPIPLHPAPHSRSFNTPMTCSSVNRFFIANPPRLIYTRKDSFQFRPVSGEQVNILCQTKRFNHHFLI
jgi:hypothetical protein